MTRWDTHVREVALTQGQVALVDDNKIYTTNCPGFRVIKVPDEGGKNDYLEQLQDFVTSVDNEPEPQAQSGKNIL